MDIIKRPVRNSAKVISAAWQCGHKLVCKKNCSLLSPDSSSTHAQFSIPIRVISVLISPRYLCLDIEYFRIPTMPITSKKSKKSSSQSSSQTKRSAYERERQMEVLANEGNELFDDLDLDLDEDDDFDTAEDALDTADEIDKAISKIEIEAQISEDERNDVIYEKRQAMAARGEELWDWNDELTPGYPGWTDPPIDDGPVADFRRSYRNFKKAVYRARRERAEAEAAEAAAEAAEAAEEAGPTVPQASTQTANSLTDPTIPITTEQAEAQTAAEAEAGPTVPQASIQTPDSLSDSTAPEITLPSGVENPTYEEIMASGMPANQPFINENRKNAGPGPSHEQEENLKYELWWVLLDYELQPGEYSSCLEIDESDPCWELSLYAKPIWRPVKDQPAAVESWEYAGSQDSGQWEDEDEDEDAEAPQMSQPADEQETTIPPKLALILKLPTLSTAANRPVPPTPARTQLPQSSMTNATAGPSRSPNFAVVIPVRPKPAQSSMPPPKGKGKGKGKEVSGSMEPPPPPPKSTDTGSPKAKRRKRRA
ncbi:hypothetical protein EDC01DRAFT_467732 [Geopyxis carbonaria]|nr:hypothetical protein EDC01DRAFT_467732 [Geopyxis carbonaria]